MKTLCGGRPDTSFAPPGYPHRRTKGGAQRGVPRSAPYITLEGSPPKWTGRWGSVWSQYKVMD
jgi:hypothetical protein